MAAMLTFLSDMNALQITVQNTTVDFVELIMPTKNMFIKYNSYVMLMV